MSPEEPKPRDRGKSTPPVANIGRASGQNASSDRSVEGSKVTAFPRAIGCRAIAAALLFQGVRR